MLSVLIPIYNFDVRDFARSLSAQAITSGHPIEIICLDDASDEAVHRLNAEVAGYSHVHYKRLDRNHGRSAVRNLLAEMASYDNLVFLDCDGRCVSNEFLRRYQSLTAKYDVVYGGRVYHPEPPDDQRLYFHWFYGSAREAALIESRLRSPYMSFMTNNFMIRKAVFEAIRLDESLEGYGHEDTLFAIELRKRGFNMMHIDNPVEHLGIEPAEVFLEKSKNAVKNLAYLTRQGKVDDAVKLVRFYRYARRFGIVGIMSWFILQREERIITNLKGVAPSLLWFDLWKLAWFHHFMKKG